MTKLTRTIATLALGTIIALPAHTATSQQGVQTCREAMTAQNSIDMNDYRLRFLNSKGNSQGRTLILKAINKNGGTSFQFTCTLNKNTVVALNDKNVVLFAKR